MLYTVVVPAEKRLLVVVKEDRVIMVPAETRMVEVIRLCY